MSSARRLLNSFLTRKAVYSEEEAFDLLFPDEKSRRVYRDDKSRVDRNLIDNIRAGKVNPIRGTEARDITEGTKIGLMNAKGEIVKRAGGGKRK